jgi:hypothetical protein
MGRVVHSDQQLGGALADHADPRHHHAAVRPHAPAGGRLQTRRKDELDCPDNRWSSPESVTVLGEPLPGKWVVIRAAGGTYWPAGRVESNTTWRRLHRRGYKVSYGKIQAQPKQPSPRKGPPPAISPTALFTVVSHHPRRDIQSPPLLPAPTQHPCRHPTPAGQAVHRHNKDSAEGPPPAFDLEPTNMSRRRVRHQPIQTPRRGHSLRFRTLVGHWPELNEVLLLAG